MGDDINGTTIYAKKKTENRKKVEGSKIHIHNVEVGGYLEYKQYRGTLREIFTSGICMLSSGI